MATDTETVASTVPDTPRMTSWLVEQGLRGASDLDVFAGFCERIVAGGIRLQRAYCAARVLHPNYAGFALIRNKNGEVNEETYTPDNANPETWAASPLKLMVDDGVPEVRRRLDTPDAAREFPVMADFQKDGATDYFGLICGYSNEQDDRRGFGTVFSWVTDKPGGFSDEELAWLRQILPIYALTFRIAVNQRIAASVASAYLGADAGRRVLQGDVRRGQVQTISAVLIYGDLGGFTALADAMPKEILIDMLNEYLTCMAGPVQEHGGQVLKFMGDGMLCTFEINTKDGAEDPRKTCERALASTLEAFALVAALNEAREAEGKPTMPLNVAMHLGDVLYGNVGSPERLDFTIIGPAVNEASRMEAMCDALERRLLISQAFADAYAGGTPELLPLGRHGLRSVREPVRLYTVTDLPGD